MWRMGKSSHERVHEWGQDRTAAENDKPREHQQEDHQRNQPPFLFLLQKRQEFFAKLPHAHIELTARYSQWQRRFFQLDERNSVFYWVNRGIYDNLTKWR
jgi:hypothetical protein